MAESILQKANRRAQRRLRAMVVARRYSYDTLEARLYVQAERLVDALQVEADWEQTKAELDAAMLADHDYHVISGLTVAECDDCAEDVAYIFSIAPESESELRFAHGDR